MEERISGAVAGQLENCSRVITPPQRGGSVESAVAPLHQARRRTSPIVDRIASKPVEDQISVSIFVQLENRAIIIEAAIEGRAIKCPVRSSD